MLNICGRAFDLCASTASPCSILVFPIRPSSAAMAYIGAAKRAFVDIDDRRRLGHWNKRARLHAESSKATLGTAAARKLLGIDKAMASMDDRFHAARQHHLHSGVLQAQR